MAGPWIGPSVVNEKEEGSTWACLLLGQTRGGGARPAHWLGPGAMGERRERPRPVRERPEGERVRPGLLAKRERGSIFLFNFFSNPIQI